MNKNAIYSMLFLLALACTDNMADKSPDTMEESTTQPNTGKIDWQGHRGARGLLPENTIPAFLKALEYPQVTTLELDLAVSKNEVLIVSHEPWMSHHICSHPDGSPVRQEEEDQLLIHQMTYEEIKNFDCGLRGNERFPDQAPLKAYKPSMRDLVAAVEAYCEENDRPLPNYNIELKSQESYDGIKTPGVERFVTLVLKAIEDLGIKDRCNLQSFDFRIVREVERQDPTVVQALLIENLKSVKTNIDSLGFTPEIYSPYFKVLTDQMVREIHERGMKVIPWTVNDKASMKMMIKLGVDGIITDYPNLIAEL